MTPLERLLGGFYNSDPVSATNPGGFADGGHVLNFPAALADLGQVMNAVVIDVDAIGDAGEMAQRAGAAATRAESAAQQAEQIASGRIVHTGIGAPSASLGRTGDFYIRRNDYLIYGPKAGSAWGDGTSLLAPAASLDVSETHIIWRLGDGDWINLIPFQALKGADAQAISLQVGGTHIQWRRGDGDWIDLIAVTDLKGVAAEELDLKVGQQHIQWRRGDGAWNNLVALADLKGADAQELGLRATATHIQWRRGDGGWADLVDLDSLRTPEASMAEVRAGKIGGKIISPKAVAGAQAPVVITRADAADGMDFDGIINATITLDASGTLGPPTGGYPGKSGVITVINGTGSASLAYASAYRMPQGGVTIEGGVNAVTRIPYMIAAAGSVILFPASKWGA